MCVHTSNKGNIVLPNFPSQNWSVSGVWEELWGRFHAVLPILSELLDLPLPPNWTWPPAPGLGFRRCRGRPNAQLMRQLLPLQSESPGYCVHPDQRLALYLRLQRLRESTPVPCWERFRNPHLRSLGILKMAAPETLSVQRSQELLFGGGL